MSNLALCPSGFQERFNVSRESADRLEAYARVLLQWQPRINLVAPSTLDLLWDRHFADSLQILKLLPQSATRVADLGSGAGFPGLVLASVAPLKVHLFEANNKKTAFLLEVIRVTGVDAQVHTVRLESLASRPNLVEVHAVTARALAPLCELIAYAHPFLERGAVGLFHKGTDVDSELTEAAKCWRIRYLKHPSVTDSKSVILEVQKADRVTN